MDLDFSDEQLEFRDSLRRFLADRASEVELRRLIDTPNGYDAQAWSLMAQQLGLQGLIVPEEYGGSGFSDVELVLVFEEMGRALLCAPYFSTVGLAVNVLIRCEDEAIKDEFLPRIAAGEIVATLAYDEGDGCETDSAIQMRSTDSQCLTGQKTFVLDGHIADLIIVAARGESGIALFAVRGDAPGLTRQPLKTLDPTRRLARLDFDGVPARQIIDPGRGWSLLTTIRSLAAVYLAAEQTGGAERALEMAVEYAKTRVQFGRPIGSFQAIKHKCADMLVDVESAKAAVYYAAQATGDENELLSVAPLVKSWCSDAYLRVAAENIQVHGGIGFTWEHPAHLYFKRAKSSELLFGDPRYHRALLAQRIGDHVRDLVTCAVAGGVADVRLNRPDKLNALDSDMFHALVDEGERLRGIPGLRVVVLSGEGRGFCAGLDFGIFAAMQRVTPERLLYADRSATDVSGGLSTGQRAVRTWSMLPVPVIAAISGPALGAGFQLMLGADLRIVAPDAQIGALEIRWGLIPDMTGTQLLPRVVGMERAKELIFTGRIIDGREAVQIGLALTVSDSPHATAMQMAARIAQQNPQAVQAAKKALDLAWVTPPDQGFAEERAAGRRLIGSPNQLEAVSARRDHRTPLFTD